MSVAKEHLQKDAVAVILLVGYLEASAQHFLEASAQHYWLSVSKMLD